MLIVCPACASAYRIDAARVGAAGRPVRCAACRETWTVTAAEVAAAQLAEMRAALEEESPAPAEAAPAAAAVIDQPAPARRPGPRKPAGRKSRGRKSGGYPSPAWAAALALAACLPLALVGRATVVRAMPQTADVFAGLGLPVNLRGIEIRDIAAFQEAGSGEGAPTRLVVEGDLVGVAGERVAVPPVEVEVRDARGQPLYRWAVPAPRPGLEPGERARFRASLSAPPAQGRSVEVRFGAADPAPAAEGPSSP